MNNHIGLPLSILSASISDDAAVWEIGMNHPGEIAPLARLARPDLAIITNIGVAHIEYMGSREAIAARKGRPGRGCRNSGSCDSSGGGRFRDRKSRLATTARVIRAGLSSGRSGASNIEMSAEGLPFHASYRSRVRPAEHFRSGRTHGAQRAARGRRGSRTRSSIGRMRRGPRRRASHRRPIDPSDPSRRHRARRHLQRESGFDGGRPGHARALSGCGPADRRPGQDGRARRARRRRLPACRPQRRQSLRRAHRSRHRNDARSRKPPVPPD